MVKTTAGAGRDQLLLEKAVLDTSYRQAIQEFRFWMSASGWRALLNH